MEIKTLEVSKEKIKYAIFRNTGRVALALRTYEIENGKVEESIYEINDEEFPIIADFIYQFVDNNDNEINTDSIYNIFELIKGVY
ncbi:MAG: hypothetical protein [Lokiarchaeia virus VerdaV1]|uniref:Uncharacterized protein n=1 Tax=Lokiarchaeia virus VerdaV1 TaxID=3070170 RepID=A0AA35G7A7_9CAUD|nr:MAG: hypothetical protein QIT41_gp22 [Lokiarchaeia virus VerdaV1]BDI54871.1 MAG: hypothetical protein [Lokiarchaeia virus VerdaV1]